MNENGKEKKWSSRFNEPLDPKALAYTASIGFDRHLWREEILQSREYALALLEAGILEETEHLAIQNALSDIEQDIAGGTFSFALADEDIHMAIERALVERLGDVGKKIHTGRSRNDQVATDFRLFVRRAEEELLQALTGLQETLLHLAKEHTRTFMPGLTHLQVAQPVTLAHHLLAYFEMFARDRQRVLQARRRAGVLPLGSGALAGTPYPIDRTRLARALGFDEVSENSLDAVSDRDFALDFLFAAALIMTHLSRLGEDLVLWTSPFFGFASFSDQHATGSSIMPQKKNPDVAELCRAKSGRALGGLVSLFTVMKAQPLAYNKDNQEDKEPVLDAFSTCKESLSVMADALAAMRFFPDAMARALEKGYATATDLADYLVARKMPFRDAHDLVSRIVSWAEKEGMVLEKVPLAALKSFSPLFEEDVYSFLSFEGSASRRKNKGGTAPEAVEKAIARAWALLEEEGSTL